MKRPPSLSAFDRLREAFRPPPSFGVVTDVPPQGPPAASLRASPAPADPLPAETGAIGDDWTWSPDDAAVGGAGGRPRRLRLDPGLPGVRVLALAGLLAAVLAGALLWWSRPSPHITSEPIVHPAARPAAAAVTVTGEATPSPSPSTVVVDVAGKVRHPGVVSLPTGARVIDALKEAGGLRPGVKTGNLNLARRVVDGEQILVGVNATPAVSGPAGPPGATTPGAPVDLNAATAEQLDGLPGVGPVLAQRIVDYRTQHGGFRSVAELRDVSGIGDAKFADLKALVRV